MQSLLPAVLKFCTVGEVRAQLQFCVVADEHRYLYIRSMGCILINRNVSLDLHVYSFTLINSDYGN